jgi:predicted nuclease of predicted toxin-antitoxin system
MLGLCSLAYGRARFTIINRMKIQLLIDMNLSPEWVPELLRHGCVSKHWSAVGDPRATDREIMEWARINNFVVFTHDLDFGTMLALTHAHGPSVIQVRGQNVLPGQMIEILMAALKQHESDLASGALVVVDESKSRSRVLPI